MIVGYHLHLRGRSESDGEGPRGRRPDAVVKGAFPYRSMGA